MAVQVFDPGARGSSVSFCHRNGALVSRTRSVPKSEIGRSERSEPAGDPPGRPLPAEERGPPGALDFEPGRWGDHPTSKRARRSAGVCGNGPLPKVLRAGPKVGSRRVGRSKVGPRGTTPLSIGISSALYWDHAGLSHSEIAALFGMPSTNSVAQTIRRTKAKGPSNSCGPKESAKS